VTTISTIKNCLLHFIGQTPNQRWNRQLNKLVRGGDSNRRDKIRVLLDNYHTSAALGHGDFRNEPKPDFDKTLITIQLEALNRMRSFDLVGFQPARGPVCKVYNLQWKSDNTDPDAMVLSVVDGIVRAERNPLEIQWPIETVMDELTKFGAEFVKEFEEASIDELALECDRNVVSDIKTVATKLISQKIGDWQTLVVTLYRMSNDIAQRSRRGSGNWAILPFDLVAMLQESPNYLHFPEENGSGLRLMGELLHSPDAEHGIKIYSDILQDDNTILVGYKGISEIDAGYIYSPYIMTVPLGIQTDTATFKPVQKFANRSGAYMHNPENYYTSIQVLG